ncbi:MAG: hypothetical protein L3J56_12935 [Bacteroidales bacterium]|nr:hypothetical protein [Bacteroidales bacterium]
MAEKRNIIKNVLTGNWLGKGIKTANMYFLLFIMFLTVLLIYNRYRAEELIVKKNKLKNDVEILHSKYTKSNTKLMTSATERQIAKDPVIVSEGLKLPKRPLPQIIIEK